MRPVVAAVAAVLALCTAADTVEAQVVPAATTGLLAAAEQRALQQEPPSDARTDRRPEEGREGDEGGVPIWAGIGLILLAAAAGSLAARARNRRRMRGYTRE